MTQERFALALGVHSGTVARWETSREPIGASLSRLEVFAIRSTQPEIAELFHQARLKAAMRVDLMLSLNGGSATITMGRDDFAEMMTMLGYAEASAHRNGDQDLAEGFHGFNSRLLKAHPDAHRYLDRTIEGANG